MTFRKSLCLLLALIIIAMCFSGCRKDKQETEEETEQQEESTGMVVSEDPFVIDVPEDEEVDEGGEDFGR